MSHYYRFVSLIVAGVIVSDSKHGLAHTLVPLTVVGLLLSAKL